MATWSGAVPSLRVPLLGATGQSLLKISVIIPAYNEESYIAATLDSINVAAERMRSSANASLETIVVDNNSRDGTAEIAEGRGARVVHEPSQGISKARNTGARNADGDVLVFVDADVIVPPAILEAIHDTMSNPSCVGGGVDVEYTPRRRSMRLYLRGWKILGRLLGMVQGATQFCRRTAFEQIGGYDEAAWIGEDVDFYWALKKLAMQTGGEVRLIKDLRVHPSSRRFDRQPVWKTLVWTNPLFIALLRRRKGVWGDWYSSAVR